MPNHQLSILAHHSAPIQIAWLAYPGTMGIKQVDYLIADKHVVPPSEQQYYVEKMIYFPECYQLNDDYLVAKKNLIENFRQNPNTMYLPNDWKEKVIYGNMNMNYKIDKFTWYMYIEIFRKTSNTLLVLVIHNRHRK